jgi:hypothetical protein
MWSGGLASKAQFPVALDTAFTQTSEELSGLYQLYSAFFVPVTPEVIPLQFCNPKVVGA